MYNKISRDILIYHVTDDGDYYFYLKKTKYLKYGNPFGTFYCKPFTSGSYFTCKRTGTKLNKYFINGIGENNSILNRILNIKQHSKFIDKLNNLPMYIVKMSSNKENNKSSLSQDIISIVSYINIYEKHKNLSEYEWVSLHDALNPDINIHYELIQNFKCNLRSNINIDCVKSYIKSGQAENLYKILNKI